MISTRPAVGFSMPAATRSSVVFPQPDGPEQAHDLRRRDVEVDAGQRLRLVVVADDVLEGELRGEGGARRGPWRRSRWQCRSRQLARGVFAQIDDDN